MNILGFWNEIYGKNIDLRYAVYKDFTLAEIQSLLNKYNDDKEDITFYIDDMGRDLYIYRKDCQVTLATIHGIKHPDRGGEGEWLTPYILRCKSGVYYKDVKVGNCLRDFGLTNSDGIIIINEKSLLKYDRDGVLLWETNLNKDTAQRLNWARCYPHAVEDHEKWLIAIEDSYTVTYYSNTDGKLYGECRISLDVVE